MKVTKTHTELSLIQHKLEIDVAGEHTGEFITKAICEIRKDTEIPGFRKGKAPDAGVVAHIGEKRVREYATKLLCADAFEEASKGLEKPAVTPPKYEYDQPILKGQDFSFSASYYIEPPDPKTLAKGAADKDKPDYIRPEDILPNGPPNIHSFGPNPVSPDALKKIPGLKFADRFIPDPVPKTKLPQDEIDKLRKPPEVEIPDPEKLIKPLDVMPDIKKELQDKKGKLEKPEPADKKTEE